MSREELLNGNAEIVRTKVAAATKASPGAVIIVFSNPMDAMCQVALKASGLPRERVIGQGGALDSARYRYFVAAELGVSVNDVHGYVIGGHTDTTMVPVVSQTRVGGVPLTDLLPAEKVQAIVARAMRGGAEIGELYKTGSAYFAPSAATIAMVEAILLDQRRLIPCSVYHQGEYGIRDVFSGTVCQLGEGGIQRTFELPLTGEERAKVVAAAEATKELLKLLN
jgi:malate dehydrogenase